MPGRRDSAVKPASLFVTLAPRWRSASFHRPANRIPSGKFGSRHPGVTSILSGRPLSSQSLAPIAFPLPMKETLPGAPSLTDGAFLANWKLPGLRRIEAKHELQEYHWSVAPDTTGIAD